MRQQATSNKKLQNFRCQIRRKHVQEIFAQKRRILISQKIKREDNIVKELQSCIEKLRNLSNVQNRVISLANLLCDNKVLEKFVEQYDKQTVQNLCVQLLNFLINTVIPYFSHTASQKLNRINVLTLISNLFADANSPCQKMISIFTQGINSIYGSAEQYGFNQQITQIGWVIGNILNRKIYIDPQSDIQRYLEMLLTWIEQILSKSDIKIIIFLYASITRFFKKIDEQYLLEQKQYFPVQHFKVHRLILLQQAVYQNTCIQMGSCLIQVLKFIESNVNLLPLCDQTLPKIFVKNCMRFLAGLSNEKTIIIGLKILNSISKNNNQIACLLIHSYLQNLTQILSSQGTNVKLKVIELLIQVIDYPELAKIVFPSKKKSDLQYLLVTFLKGMRDTEILLKIMYLTNNILNLTQGECGAMLYWSIGQLVLRPGQVGVYANYIMESYHLHNEQL